MVNEHKKRNGHQKTHANEEMARTATNFRVKLQLFDTKTWVHTCVFNRHMVAFVFPHDLGLFLHRHRLRMTTNSHKRLSFLRECGLILEYF